MKRKTAVWLVDKPWHRIRNEMLLSPAWKAASHLQRSMITVMLSELGRHGGKDNGHLIFTNKNFAQYGFTTGRIIKRNLAALAALGFIAVKAGRPGLRGYGKARRYRLTFLPILDSEGNEIEVPTDEWSRFSTTKAAKMAASRAYKNAEVVKTRVQSPSLYSGVQSPSLRSEAQPHVEPQPFENIEGDRVQSPSLSTSRLTSLPLVWSTPTLTDVTGEEAVRLRAALGEVATTW